MKSENTEFNQKEYLRAYMKERRKNIKPFKVDLTIQEKEELDELLVQHNISKVEFLKNAINNFKEELKMKKYYIYCGTEHYEKTSNGWESRGETTQNINDKYIKVYDTYEKAINTYNSIALNCEKNNCSMYADFKQLFEYDSTKISDDDIEDGNFNIDNMRLLKEDYSFEK